MRQFTTISLGLIIGLSFISVTKSQFSLSWLIILIVAVIVAARWILILKHEEER
jgi:hypothetical protein